MSNVQTVEIVVKKKDNLWNIVKAHGFPPKDWKKIYNAPYNKRFRSKCPDANIIQPGNKFNLPKYAPKDVAEIVKKIEGSKRRLDKIGTSARAVAGIIKQLEDMLKKKQKLDRKKVQDLKKQAEIFDTLADDAANECEDMYSCMGAGLVSDKFQRKSRGFSKKAGEVEKQAAKGDQPAKISIDALKKALEGVDKERAALQADITRRKAEWKKASKNPY